MSEIPGSGRYSHVTPRSNCKPTSRKPFSVFWTNHNIEAKPTFDDAIDALDYATFVGFDARIDNERGECVAFWTAINGVQWFNVDRNRDTIPDGEIDAVAPTLRSIRL